VAKDRHDENWRQRLYEIIFEADTPVGKLFDVTLIGTIVASVLVVMADSVASFSREYGPWLHGAEWGFTIFFSVEYLLRLLCVRRPVRYAFSLLGIVDLLAIVPTYLSLFFPGTQYLLVIRVLRVLRIFRVLKLAHYLGEMNVLARALAASRRKIIGYLFAVLTLVVVFGSLMYLVEGAGNGFTSIPKSIYWAIVTMTTVGYGDISPGTNLGQTLASLIMILGYGIIAVPTGIVTTELGRSSRPVRVSTQVCPSCLSEGHDPDAVFCKYCGERMNGEPAGENA
jgi:voltage-gated potassium channel